MAKPGKKADPTIVRSRPDPLPARLNINLLPEGTVMLDGHEVGQIRPDGKLKLEQHTLTVVKPGYHQYQGGVDLRAGANDVDVNLQPYPGNLSVTANVSGLSITVIGNGTYNEVSRLELAPGSYQVQVAKLGYKTAEGSVAIKPGTATNLALTLDLLPVAELQAQTEAAFNSGNYNDALALGQYALNGDATHAHMQLIVGLSYVRTGDYNAAADHIGQALRLGEPLQIPVKHFHKQGHNEGLCSGILTLRRGFLEFCSDQVAVDNFSAPLYKASGLRVDWDKGGRVVVQIRLPKGKKEAPFAYSFHPAQAYLRRKDQNKANSPTLVDCSNCQPAAQLLYQLIAQLGR